MAAAEAKQYGNNAFAETTTGTNGVNANQGGAAQRPDITSSIKDVPITVRHPVPQDLDKFIPNPGG